MTRYFVSLNLVKPNMQKSYSYFEFCEFCWYHYLSCDLVDLNELYIRFIFSCDLEDLNELYIRFV